MADVKLLHRLKEFLPYLTAVVRCYRRKSRQDLVSLGTTKLENLQLSSIGIVTREAIRSDEVN